MAIDRYYTPQALADATGLHISQCRSLIAQSEDSICISRDPNSKKPRYAISEKGFNKLVETQKNRRKVAMFESQQPAKKPARQKRTAVAGLNPDGTIMNRKQLKAAGLYKEGAK